MVAPLPPILAEMPLLLAFNHKPGKSLIRLRKRNPISEKGQIAWIGSATSEILESLPLVIALVDHVHVLVGPTLDTASLGFSGTTAIFDPLPDVFRSQVFDLDHGFGSWFSVVVDLLKLSLMPLGSPRRRKNRSQAAAIAQL